MRCKNCGEREATVHLTRIVDSDVSQVHLCESCAVAKGVDVTPPDPVERIKTLVAFIPQIEAGHDPQAKSELLRKFRELAAVVPSDAVPNEAKAYLARHPT